MSKMNMVRRCYSCGAILQSQSKDQPGYLPSEILEADSPYGVLFCEQCYKESQFHLAPVEPEVKDDYISMLEDAQASDAMIVYVVDVFSFESSFISRITNIIEGLKILVIANKRDLLPKSVKDSELKEYVAHRFRRARLSVTANDVVLTSLTSNTDIKPIVDKIEAMRRKHDVYVIGAAGSGKTLFVNSFLRNYKNITSKNIMTVNYPGTSIRTMTVPLDSSSFMYDTPGTSVDNSVLSKVDLNSMRMTVPTETIRGKGLTLSAGESLFIGGIGRIDLIKGKPTPITAYFSREVGLKKCRSNVDTNFIKGIANKSFYPIAPGITDLVDFDAFDVVIDEKKERDIGIEGLGWITFKGAKQTFRVYVPKGTSIFSSRAKIK
ncbi:MAG: hypothetical protein MJ239_06780 [Bacilli bacterium]|nr:hypothetical protein [Bacilli bacterium]